MFGTELWLTTNRVQRETVINFWNELISIGNVFYLVDFARYVILSLHKGVYVDMDIELKLPLVPNTQYIYASRKKYQKRRKITNSLMCLRGKGIYVELIEFIIERYYKCKIDRSWDRHLLFSVGALSYAAFCKGRKLVFGFNETTPWIKDYGTTAWVGLNKRAHNVS